MPDINKLYTAEDAESKEYENVVYILIINSLKKQVQFINMKNQKQIKQIVKQIEKFHIHLQYLI